MDKNLTPIIENCENWDDTVDGARVIFSADRIFISVFPPSGFGQEFRRFGPGSSYCS